MADDSDHRAGGAPPREPKFIAVAHQKGGTGKTTTVCNLASCFTNSTPGLRVVVLDLDPQAASSNLLRDNDGSPPVGAYDVIVSGQIAKGAIRRTKVRNCLLIPATERLVMSELDEATRALAFADVKRALRANLAGIDVVVIDCPAGVGTIATLAMAIGDIIVLPTPPGSSEIRALHQTAEHVRRLRRDANACLTPVITMWDGDDPDHTAAAEQLRNVYPGRVLDVPVPRDSAVHEAIMKNELVVARSPAAPAARAYRRLAALIGERLGFAMTAGEEPPGESMAPSIRDRAEPHAAPVPEVLRAPPSAPSMPSEPDPERPPARPSPKAPGPFTIDDTLAAPGSETRLEDTGPFAAALPPDDTRPARRLFKLVARLVLATVFLAASAVGTFLVLLEPSYLAWVAVGLTGLVVFSVSAWYLKWI